MIAFGGIETLNVNDPHTMQTTTTTTNILFHHSSTVPLTTYPITEIGSVLLILLKCYRIEFAQIAQSGDTV